MNTIDPTQLKPDAAGSRELFEFHHCGNNKDAIRRNEQGDYVLPAIQDAWAGWQTRDVLDVSSLGHRTMKHITDPNELVPGLSYWLVEKLHPQHIPPVIEKCVETGPNGWRYFTTGRMWAMDFNNQAMQRWDIFGPVPAQPLPDFKRMKKESSEQLTNA